MDDSKIVDLFFKRDEEAIQQVSTKYGRLLRTISFRITGDVETAEECENDTYLQAWKLIPPHEPRNYLVAFLSRIVRNISIDRCIHNNRLKRKCYLEGLSVEMEQFLPSDVSVESEVERKLLAEKISSFLRTQTKEKRMIFMRRYFGFEAVKYIAKKMNCKETRVYTVLHRMREDLREYLKQEEII
ncbi:MAG: RNA polymerase sigma factor [Clostridiales bacterium]|nr:RNA polymerase sigma factor [Clostridiales bacterium]